MKNKLIVGCSSFVNPQHKSWNFLKDVYEIQFLEYGNLSDIVNEKYSGDSLGYIQFLDDALCTDHSGISYDIAIDFLRSVLSLLEVRCCNSKKPFIFCFSFWAPDNVIRQVKKISERRKLNIWLIHALETLASRHSSFYFIDLDACFGEVGLSKCFDSRNWYFAHSRMSALGFEVVADSISSVLTRHNHSPHKVLVLDCDNTLWGGVIGEDGISGLALGTDGIGQVYVDFQKAVLRRKEEGVLLAISSKNNDDDVWNVFDNHESMVLSRSDIVAAKINWDDKARNIGELSAELDLDVSSFVFWDDNPFEREKVKAALPSMCTIDVPEKIWEWTFYIDSIFELSKFYITKDDKNKTSQYSARRNFLTSKNKSLNELSFLKKIELQAQLVPFGDSNCLRATQLCQKTNQFNLTTRRYTAECLQRFASENPLFCSLVKLKDKFGNHGLVGLFCLHNLNDSDLYIDTFLISCRILGRQLEFWMMSQIIEVAIANDFTRLVAEYIPSAKNNVAEKFLEDCGFLKCTHNLQNNIFDSTSPNPSKFLYSRNLTRLDNFDESLYEN